MWRDWPFLSFCPLIIFFFFPRAVIRDIFISCSWQVFFSFFLIPWMLVDIRLVYIYIYIYITWHEINFQRSLAYLKSEFSFSQTGCHTNTEESILLWNIGNSIFNHKQYIHTNTSNRQHTYLITSVLRMFFRYDKWQSIC